eukprot:15018121-Alexandrium_andersonii.AAC.1
MADPSPAPAMEYSRARAPQVPASGKGHPDLGPNRRPGRRRARGAPRPRPRQDLRRAPVPA